MEQTATILGLTLTVRRLACVCFNASQKNPSSREIVCRAQGSGHVEGSDMTNRSEQEWRRGAKQLMLSGYDLRYSELYYAEIE